MYKHSSRRQSSSYVVASLSSRIAFKPVKDADTKFYSYLGKYIIESEDDII